MAKPSTPGAIVELTMNGEVPARPEAHVSQCLARERRISEDAPTPCIARTSRRRQINTRCRSRRQQSGNCVERAAQDGQPVWWAILEPGCRSRPGLPGKPTRVGCMEKDSRDGRVDGVQFVLNRRHRRAAGQQLPSANLAAAYCANVTIPSWSAAHSPKPPNQSVPPPSEARRGEAQAPGPGSGVGTAPHQRRPRPREPKIHPPLKIRRAVPEFEGPTGSANRPTRGPRVAVAWRDPCVQPRSQRGEQGIKQIKVQGLRVWSTRHATLGAGDSCWRKSWLQIAQAKERSDRIDRRLTRGTPRSHLRRHRFALLSVQSRAARQKRASAHGRSCPRPSSHCHELAVCSHRSHIPQSPPARNP
ncbi:hypothetical protein ACCO45_011300 [Purpureocillium lilacinum]|uniref:Uncharacterized protein n=1 Tax=Purpureocillium lilacinum TaxID=33203 RepID=A0ACC4DHX4_PURLI